MKNNHVKELTEGMQRLCAVANRVVAAEGHASRIDMDLLKDELRRLYDVAWQMAPEGESAGRRPSTADEEPMPDHEILSSTVMATMAAMGTAEQPVMMPMESVENEVKNEEPELELKNEEPELELQSEEPEPKNEEPEEQEPVENEKPQEEIKPVSMSEFETDGQLLFDEIILETPEQPEKPEVAEAPEVTETPETPVAVETPEVTEIPEPAKTPEVTEKPVHAQPQQASLLDYLKHPLSDQPTVRTIGDQLGNSHTTAASQGLASKVSDLRTVININDKFSFMSELFKNNMRGYNDFIMQLNAIGTRKEAMALVAEVSAQYKWDENSQAVQSFWKIFDKKF